jgi:hypothetical protein
MDWRMGGLSLLARVNALRDLSQVGITSGPEYVSYIYTNRAVARVIWWKWIGLFILGFPLALHIPAPWSVVALVTA